MLNAGRQGAKFQKHGHATATEKRKYSEVQDMHTTPLDSPTAESKDQQQWVAWSPHTRAADQLYGSNVITYTRTIYSRWI